MNIKLTCPLGSVCEEIKDNQIYRCCWYTLLRGKNPQGEELIDEWKCAIVWLPLMLVENSQAIRGSQAAIESFRNESVKSQDVLSSLIGLAISRAKALNTQAEIEGRNNETKEVTYLGSD